jgi:hypothetical protein
MFRPTPWQTTKCPGEGVRESRTQQRNPNIHQTHHVRNRRHFCIQGKAKSPGSTCLRVVGVIVVKKEKKETIINGRENADSY